MALYRDKTIKTIKTKNIMLYIRIINDGLIETEDLSLVGSSTKRGVDGKIGEFGSGNKFSLAWYFRNNCVPILFRGTERMFLGTKKIKHRDNEVEIITINDKETSITTGMGPKWTGWMALRETISNAIDEEGFEMHTFFNPEFVGIENKTVFYIPLNEELNKVTSNLNYYFSFDRTPIFENEIAQVFVKCTDKANIYRQSIRCYDDDYQIEFDINFFDIEINESRLTSGIKIDSRMNKFIYEGISKEVMHLVLSSKEFYILPNRFSEHNLEVIKDMVADGKTFSSKSINKLAGLLGTGDSDYVIDDHLYNQLVREKIIEGLEVNSSLLYKEIDPSPRLEEIKYFLKAFNIDYPLVSVITNSFGVATWENNQRILVSKSCTDNNRIISNLQIAHHIVRNIPMSVFSEICT